MRKKRFFAPSAVCPAMIAALAPYVFYIHPHVTAERGAYARTQSSFNAEELMGQQRVLRANDQ